MIKISRVEMKGGVVFAIGGRVEETDLPELQRVLDSEAGGKPIVLDLEDVRLVDREVVGFLAQCEAKQIRLENCPAYVREWMEKRSESHE
jgi:anti-anti-sigma regulatory factor